MALKGTQTDGHAYIGKAIEKGASAVVCETYPDQLEEGITYIKIADTEEAVGNLPNLFLSRTGWADTTPVTSRPGLL